VRISPSSVLEVGVELTVGQLLVDDSLGVGEALLETGVESLVALGADSLLLAASFGVFGLEGSKLVLVGLLLGSLGASADNLGVGVESLHELLVLQGVGVGGAAAKGVLSHGLELVLNLVGVDDSSEISASHHGSVQLVARLLDGLLSVGTEHLVEVGECILGEDHESAEMTTRGELEEVKAVHGANVNTGKVAGGSLQVGVLVTVHNEGAASGGETRVSGLVEASAGGLGGTDAAEIIRDTDVLESGEESLGGVNVEGVNNKGELGHVVDVVAAGNNERSNSGSSEGGSNGVSLLVGVNLAVPLSPGLERGEHATLAAHVTESSLAGAGGTGARDTGDTGHSATSAPRLSRVLLASLEEDTVGLASVLGHVSVDKLNGVITDGGGEDSGHGHLVHVLVLLAINAHDGSCGHLFFRIDNK
jgi:hypothetical protein